jgi:hypothetical protein
MPINGRQSDLITALAQLGIQVERRAEAVRFAQNGLDRCCLSGIAESAA